MKLRLIYSEEEKRKGVFFEPEDKDDYRDMFYLIDKYEQFFEVVDVSKTKAHPFYALKFKLKY